MKNQREIYEALLAGKKIRCSTWSKSEHVYLSESGDLVDEDGELFFELYKPTDWEAVEEPDVYEVECEWRKIAPAGIVVPSDNSGFNWDQLVGKRGTLRFEVKK